MENNWIDQVLEECDHVETPRSWLWWSCACAISAAMGNNYYLRVLKGAVEFRANIYVILLGESGLGKEFPVSLSKEITERADVTRVIAGRSSIQAIVQKLSRAETRADGKTPFRDSRGFIVNGELSTAVIQDPSALTILTDLYDRKSSWTNLLKGDGPEKLKDPYLTCLFGSSPAHFYESIPQVNIEGGYIGRNLIIQEEKRYKETDLFDSTDDITENFPYDKFAIHLMNIHSQGGRIIADVDSKELFNTWRKKWRSQSVPDKTGFINRVPAHILKTAMVLCLADKEPKLVINQGHMEEAIDRVVPLAYSSRKASEGTGVDPLSAQTKMILGFLITATDNQRTRKQLLTLGYGNYDTVVLDKIIDNLTEIGWVERTRILAGVRSDWLIKLSGEQLEAYKEHLRRKQK